MERRQKIIIAIEGIKKEVS
ncbi:Protein of unknown function [Bacillus cereus]|nr:Protein of unknown function [Bacillus cereus]